MIMNNKLSIFYFTIECSWVLNKKNRQMIDLLIMLLTFDKTIIRKVKFYTFKGIFIILKRQLKSNL